MKNSTVTRWFATLAHGLAVLTAILAIWVAPVPAWADKTPFSGIVVFGDSVSDGGTAGKGLYYWTGGAMPLPPYWEGRFSDGPVWVEYLAQDLGMAGLLDDYAVGGATSGAQINGAESWWQHGVKSQIEDYLTSHEGDPDALYIVAVGYNDMYIPLFSDPMGDMDAARSAYYQNTIDNINTLWAAGARHILVWNLMGADALTVSFNDKLAAALAELAAEGVPTIRMDMWAFANVVYANPEQFGFTNMTGDPYPGDPIPGYANFGGHPSTQFHRLIAQFGERCLLDYFSPSRGKGQPPAQVNALNGLVRAGKP